MLALRGRDSAVISQILGQQSINCTECRSVAHLAASLSDDASATIVTEESLEGVCGSDLAGWLKDQSPWSDFQFILLANKRVGKRPEAAVAILETLGNVVLLERPIHGDTLFQAVHSALRGRRRQWEARRHLAELRLAEESLTQLNNSLEQSIVERTSELSRANDRLTGEIAERERAQSALVQSQKMEAVGQLTGGIAHDFNNLLTVISGNLNMIHRRATDPKTETQAGHAIQAADRAAKLTQQLLIFSRTQKLMLEPVDLNALLRGMSDLLERTIGTDAEVELDLDPGQPWALADKNQLELAILNLAINARDAMVDGGKISIRSFFEQRKFPDIDAHRFGVITVHDTGPGIPSHLVERVFDPFFTTKPVGKGTGLGLSQVYGIAQQSGGTVLLESEAGSGTSVSVWLPLAPRTATTPQQRKSATHAIHSRNLEIFVVEDDAEVRRFIIECLESYGCKVRYAANGMEALAQLAEGRPDLLMVDFAMPGMNGAELVQKAWLLHPDVPVLLATGYADMEMVEKIIPPECVLRKPFRSEELLAAINAVMAETEV